MAAFAVFCVWQIGKIRGELNDIRDKYRLSSERTRLIWEEVRLKKWGITVHKLNDIWAKTREAEKELSS